MSFKGWVPTVNGRLSFKIIGETRYPTEAHYANASTKTHQYVLACQDRNLSDVLFDRVLSKLLRVDGHFDFVFCSRARRRRADAMLVGRVYVSKGGRTGLRHARGYDDVVNGLRSLDFEAGNSAARQLYLRAHDILMQASDFYADVTLHRNGLIGICRITWRSADVFANSLSYAEQTGTDLEHSIADQIFYFVRDLSHQHQHHGADADTITSTVRSNNSGINWAADIVFSLYYHIITIKRRSDPIDHVRVLGVLAYIRSFKNIMKAVEEEKQLSAGIPTFDDDATKESVTATKNYIELLTSRRRQTSDAFRTVLFAVTATALTLISFISGFASPEVRPIPVMQELANFLRTHAYVCFLPLLVLVVWLISNFTFADRYDFKRDVIRLTLVNRSVSALVIIGLALIIGWLAVYWGWPALGTIASKPFPPGGR